MPTTPTSTEEEIGFSQMCLRALLQRKLKHLDGRRLYAHVGPLDACGNLLIDCTPQAPKRKQASSETKVFSQDGFFLLTRGADISRRPEENKYREMATYLDKHRREDRFFPKTTKGFPEVKTPRKGYFPRRVFPKTKPPQRGFSQKETWVFLTI